MNELQTQNMKKPSQDGLCCEFCFTTESPLYEGWFKAVATNEWNKGTATDGLMQLRVSCAECAKRAGKHVE
jgi:hypothetical protein